MNYFQDDSSEMLEEKFINEVNQMILDSYSIEIGQLRKKINLFLEKIISNNNRELFSKIYSHFNSLYLQEIKKVTQGNFQELIQILKTIIKLSSKVNFCKNVTKNN